MPRQAARQAARPPLHQPRLMNPKIWRACAGASVRIPTLHSRVYYFPQGHFDQASSLPSDLSPLLRARAFVLCQITSVQFLADPHTDEVFAKLVLVPVSDCSAASPSVPPTAASDDDDVVSFAKILTPSDANNGGGFSVPRFCADTIFPPLNFQDDPPVQNLSVTDVHGVAWEFRHIYRGTPRRHLLTTGWSKFVNNKKLVAGDSVVFMKNSRGGLFIGVRRATRFPSGKGGGKLVSNWTLPIGEMENRVEEEEKEEEEKLSEVFSRDGKGKLSTQKVAEAAEFAALNMAFEVVYYPKAGWSEFVVDEEAVNEAMNVAWGPGMRVKMAMETDDSSRMTWFQGTVSCVSINENGQWRHSPWRMLQITWDEPEVLRNSKWVSPWQVELVPTTHALHSGFPPPGKRFRYSHGSGMFNDGEGDPFSMTGFTNSAMTSMNQTLLSYGSFPAGMQGARHDLVSASKFSNFPSDASHLYMGNFFGNNTVPRLTTLPKEPNVGNSDNLSSNSNIPSPSDVSRLYMGNSFGNKTEPRLTTLPKELTFGNSDNLSSKSNIPSDVSRLYMGNSFGNNMVPRLTTLPTELNVGNSQSDNLSPNGNGSLHSCAATELVGNHNCNSTEPGNHSFPSDTSCLCMGNSFGNNTEKRLTLSTELNVGSSQSDNLSPNSNSSLHSCATKVANCNSTRPESVSFHLFGKFIQVECDLCGTGLTGNETEGRRTGNETEDRRTGNETEGRRTGNEPEGISNPLDDQSQSKSISKVEEWYYSK